MPDFEPERPRHRMFPNVFDIVVEGVLLTFIAGSSGRP